MARVASPQLKIVLGAMVAMMVVVVYWCIFGTINHKVKAQGVVFPFGEASSVSVPYDGSVSRVLVNHGATVRKGTAVMEIRNALSTTSVVAPRDGVVSRHCPLAHNSRLVSLWLGCCLKNSRWQGARCSATLLIMT